MMSCDLTEARRQELAPAVRQYAERAMRKAARRYRDRVEVADIEQAAWVILSTSLRTYNPAKGPLIAWVKRVLFLRLGAEVYRLARPIKIPRVRGDRPHTLEAALGVRMATIDRVAHDQQSDGNPGPRSWYRSDRSPQSVVQPDAEAYTIEKRAWAACGGDMNKFAAEVRRQLGIEPAPRAWSR